MIVLTESGTLDHTILGMFEDRAHMLAEVASEWPKAHIETFREYEWLSVQDDDTAFANIAEVELNTFYG